jgi:hypothetical protein
MTTTELLAHVQAELLARDNEISQLKGIIAVTDASVSPKTWRTSVPQFVSANQQIQGGYNGNAAEYIRNVTGNSTVTSVDGDPHAAEVVALLQPAPVSGLSLWETDGSDWHKTQDLVLNWSVAE